MGEHGMVTLDSNLPSIAPAGLDLVSLYVFHRMDCDMISSDDVVHIVYVLVLSPVSSTHMLLSKGIDFRSLYGPSTIYMHLIPT